MKKFVLSALFVILFLGTACNNVNEKSPKEEKPSSVELRNADGSYRLFVNDEPFFVEGAGLNNGDIALLAEHGANSIRAWSGSEEVLDEARENGLMVMMGLSVAKERHGFDYNDEKAVKEQFEKIKLRVLSMKDHPALLGWGIGNELNLSYTNLKVWDAVEEIAAFIHEVDGKHPVTTMLAGIGKREVDYIREHCPNIDFISIQLYGAIERLPELIRKAGYTGPYLITEWGTTGHWEVPVTAWNAPIENTSTEKARDFKHRYESIILADSTACMGSYVFLWGQKQERTPTWYGLFTEDGRVTETVDVMHYLWKETWPENRAPKIMDATLDNKTRYDNITLMPGETYDVSYDFIDPDGDSVEVRMELLKESTDLKEGGDREARPESLDMTVSGLTDSGASIVSPDEPGPYRLFIYGTDGHNHAATVNIPFLIQ
ncbi:MAG: glycoside hydrolase family 2 TIM barrel-domain containing protein [Bacteroidales bacterium]|nr:glycoside hydrolase family 2 TIM barrel-domain containing protein [Bacteroidales bacterium]